MLRFRLPRRWLLGLLFLPCVAIYWMISDRNTADPTKSSFQASIVAIPTREAAEYNPNANDIGLEEDSVISEPSETEFFSPETVPQYEDRPKMASHSAVDSTSVLNNDGSGGLSWPTSGSLSSRYGPRGRGYHRGIDLAAAYGAPIRAAKAGTVTLAGWYYDYGKTVIISHPDGTQTLYAHASQINVNSGQTVEKGQLIGRVGRTGRSTGPHLHFEVHVNGKRVNPLAYLK